jgi:hypothetical protein
MGGRGSVRLTKLGGGGATGVTGAAAGAAGSTDRGKGVDALVVCVTLTPFPLAPKGPAISSETSSFRRDRRGNWLGSNRAIISLSGNEIAFESFSLPEFKNASGAAARNSPKVTLTLPEPNCLTTLSVESVIAESAGTVCANFARNSAGNDPTIHCMGRESWLTPGAAVGVGRITCLNGLEAAGAFVVGSGGGRSGPPTA